MPRDRYQQMGQALRHLLPLFQPDLGRHRGEEIRQAARKIAQLAQEIAEPLLQKETQAFLQKLEQFLEEPTNHKKAKAAASSALHLEQETREI